MNIWTRTKKIVLNERTIEIFEKKKRKMKKLEQQITKGIRQEDLETFIKVLNIMKENIKEEEI